MITLDDFHTHILPGIDDGSDSVQESIEMLQAETAQGVHRVVATPHFYGNYTTPQKFLRNRAEAEMRMREAIAGKDGFPEILMGAEVHFFSGVSESDVLNQLTIGVGNSILIEMPQSEWTAGMYRELEAMYVRHGIIPIIAHIDRYISPFQTRGIPERLADLPVLVQANANFFLNRWTQAMALNMLKKGKIHLLGSDCHDLIRRPPKLGDAVQVIRRKLGDHVVETVAQCADFILADN